MSKTMRWIRFAIIGFTLWGQPAVAGAQIGVTYHSLESRICVAARVYYGSATRWKRTVIVPKNGRRQGSNSTIPDGVVQYTLGIEIKEVLKGPKRDRVRLVMETSHFDKRVEEWADQESTFLLFVNEPDRAEGRKPQNNVWPPPWTYLRLTKPAPGEKSIATQVPPIFSHDGTVLREPATILDRAREFAILFPKNLKVHELYIPRRTADLCSPSGDANRLIVPIAPALETTAKRMLSSPQNFLPARWQKDEFSRSALRLAGVGALRHFKSADNKKLLQSLFNDPMSQVADINSGKHEGKRVREFPIRAEAWKILEAWKTNTPKPVTREIIATGPASAN